MNIVEGHMLEALRLIHRMKAHLNYSTIGGNQMSTEATEFLASTHQLHRELEQKEKQARVVGSQS